MLVDLAGDDLAGDLLGGSFLGDPGERPLGERRLSLVAKREALASLDFDSSTFFSSSGSNLGFFGSSFAFSGFALGF